jgi:hypothetical protein
MGGFQTMFRLPVMPASCTRRGFSFSTAFLACAALVCAASRAGAHGIPESSHEAMIQGGVIDYIWLGAEHMVTGYDHLLFLFGVIFFLDSFRDVVRFITAFTLGHCITLLGATLAGITANAHLIDAIIALSVIYKGFENLDGFKKLFNIRAPNLLFMVFLFGLIHGFGLSTRLQELTLGSEGLVSRILAFNVGVEVGQVAALTVMLAFFRIWRSTESFLRFGKMANVGLVLAGVGLFIFQMNGYAHDEARHAPRAAEQAVHGHGHHIETADGSSHAHGVEAKEADPEHHGHDHRDEADPKPHDHDHSREAEEAGSGHGHGHSQGGDDGAG